MRTNILGVRTVRKSPWREKSELGVLARLWPYSEPLEEMGEEDELISMMWNEGKIGVYIALIHTKSLAKRRTG